MLAMPEKKPFSAYALAFFVISTLLFGLLSALIGGSGGYEQLVAPPLAPPRILFPIVWTILYIAMGVAAYFVWQTDDADRIPAIRLYYVQLAVNALWSLFFFRLDWRLFAFFWILLLIGLIVATWQQFRRLSTVAGWLLVPYLLWCVFAAYLNLGYYLLNA